MNPNLYFLAKSGFMELQSVLLSSIKLKGLPTWYRTHVRGRKGETKKREN